jgi:hypothetical protein
LSEIERLAAALSLTRREEMDIEALRMRVETELLTKKGSFWSHISIVNTPELKLSPVKK